LQVEDTNYYLWPKSEKEMKNRANYYLIISAGVLMNWGCNQAPTDSDLLTGLKEDVFFLAADDLGGRAIGTEGEQKAADYLEA